ncbi:MAG: hypothetical protein JNK05_15335 [Myxococcales bacterium]|nr:hypothetical protein [Myxococcales bacterium]
MSSTRSILRWTTLGCALALAGCRRPSSPSDAGARPAGPPRHTQSRSLAPYGALRVASRDVRFDTERAMRAGVEMQTSGEPFAEFIGRALAGYDRNAREPDRYEDDSGARTDPTGYAAAVESYEYSRQPMNNVAFESGAGLSLVFSPTLARLRSADDGSLARPALRGQSAIDAMRALVTSAALATHAGTRVQADARPQGFVTVPVPEDNPLNRLGFGGLWATSVPFVGFDPTIRPSNNIARGCTIEGGYGASAGQSVLVGDYECGYSSLHLPSRFGQVERELSAGATGATLWKNALWIVNYLQLFHDGEGRAVASVAPADLARVGAERNDVVGRREDGSPSRGGVYLGASDIEGFHGALLVASALATTEWLLSTALVRERSPGFAGFSSMRELDAYALDSPPRWMPARIAVDEREDTVAGFPSVDELRVTDRAPSLAAQLSLVSAFATLFALVDDQNPEVGASPTARAYFDGDPFDRAFARGRFRAALRWSLLVLEQGFLRDASAGRYTSSSRFEGRASETLTVQDVAMVVQTLRLARRSITGRLVLYGDATPDPRATRSSLDEGERRLFGEETAVARIGTRIRVHAQMLVDSLTTDEGEVRRGVVRDGRVMAEPSRLEDELAAVRGLLEAHLATGEVRYRDRALRVWQRFERERWDESLGLYRTGASREDANDLRWSAEQWGYFTAAAREIYKLVASRPGEGALGQRVLARWTRASKLILNGWNDRDRDDRVDWPSECVYVRDGLVRGGLQMAERALTGETGQEGERPTADRDRDCVPEIDDAALPAALATSVTFEVVR